MELHDFINKVRRGDFINAPLVYVNFLKLTDNTLIIRQLYCKRP